MEEYTYVKFLGSGMQGSAHLVERGGKIYVIKIQKILDSESVRSKNVLKTHWKEIYALEKISKFDTVLVSHFPKLMEIEIKHKCDYTHSVNDSNMSRVTKDFLNKLNKSSTCLLYSFEFKGNPVDINNLSKKLLYSILPQVIYSANELNKRGISHNDLHWGNIVTTLSDNVNVNIKNKKVKLHTNILCSLVDFGNVDIYQLHNDPKQKAISMDRAKSSLDIMYFLIKGVLGTFNLEFCKLVIDKFIDTPLWKIIYDKDPESVELYLERKTENSFTYFDYAAIIRMVLYVYSYRDVELNILHESYFKNKLRSIIPKKEVLYIINNIHSVDNIIIYYNKLLKDL
jgi:hypothetical protein